MSDFIKRLNRPIVDLEDVRLVMEALKELRENELKFDAMMAPIKEGYARSLFFMPLFSLLFPLRSLISELSQ